MLSLAGSSKFQLLFFFLDILMPPKQHQDLRVKAPCGFPVLGKEVASSEGSISARDITITTATRLLETETPGTFATKLGASNTILSKVQSVIPIIRMNALIKQLVYFRVNIWISQLHSISFLGHFVVAVVNLHVMCFPSTKFLL